MAALALTPTLLPFQRRALDELVAGDGLAVFSAGLGWHGVVAALLHLQARRRWGLAGGVGGVGHGGRGAGAVAVADACPSPAPTAPPPRLQPAARPRPNAASHSLCTSLPHPIRIP